MRCAKRQTPTRDGRPRLIAGKAVALSAYDMLTNPAKLKAVQDGFKEAKAKEGK